MYMTPIFKQAMYLVIALALFSCGKDTNKLADFDIDTLKNQTNTFEFQVSNIKDVEDDVSYTWTNEGTKAKVDLSSTLSSGSGTITIKDAAGTTVYSSDITVDGSFDTTEGASGSWTIEVKLSEASGTLNFSVEKS